MEVLACFSIAAIAPGEELAVTPRTVLLFFGLFMIAIAVSVAASIVALVVRATALVVVVAVTVVSMFVMATVLPVLVAVTGLVAMAAAFAVMVAVSVAVSASALLRLFVASLNSGLISRLWPWSWGRRRSRRLRAVLGYVIR